MANGHLHREIGEEGLEFEADEVGAVQLAVHDVVGHAESLAAGRAEDEHAAFPRDLFVASAGWTAAATFAGSVHGVVVHRTSAAGAVEQVALTYSDGLSVSVYEPSISCCDRLVPQRVHHGRGTCPSYRYLRSKHFWRKYQIASMLSSE